MAVTARSKRPMFTGQRLTVFEWMVDDLMRMLGQHADAFDLHEWFFACDAVLVNSPLIAADWWPWLKQQTVDEAERRGLSVMRTSAVRRQGPMQNEWVPWECSHTEPKCSARGACGIREQIEEGRRSRTA